MPVHLQMGATNKETGKHENPIRASKANKYECPDCKRDVILRQGEIKRAHFAHKASEHPCGYFENPGEAEIHKEAKESLKAQLESGAKISVIRPCGHDWCKKKEEFDIPAVSSNSKIVLEHSFQYNGLKKADVAYLEDDQIFCIIEILNTSVTKEENRYGDWFEFDARDVVNNTDNEVYVCKRVWHCQKCAKWRDDSEKRYEEGNKRKIKSEENEKRFQEQLQIEREKQRLRDIELQRRHNEDMQRALSDRQKAQQEYEKGIRNLKRERKMMELEDLRTIQRDRECFEREKKRLRLEIEKEKEEKKKAEIAMAALSVDRENVMQERRKHYLLCVAEEHKLHVSEEVLQKTHTNQKSLRSFFQVK